MSVEAIVAFSAKSDQYAELWEDFVMNKMIKSDYWVMTFTVKEHKSKGWVKIGTDNNDSNDFLSTMLLTGLMKNNGFTVSETLWGALRFAPIDGTTPPTELVREV